jgi:3-oxoacyl-[acyl-carrier protein] reductase
LVTGAARGIGRAIATALVSGGLDVTVTDVDGDLAARTAAEIGGRAHPLDVSDAGAVAALAAEFSDLDVLVNNAGIVPGGPLAAVSTEQFHTVMAVNVLGPLLTTQAFAEALAAGDGGAVVNIASMSAGFPVPGTGIYSASKAALVSLTQSSALEFGPRIRVNAVAPGRISTEATAARRQDRAVEERTDGLIPAGRSGEVDDVADVVCFLASRQARYVTGQTVYVDGGLTVGTIAHFSRAQRTSGES